MFISDGYKYTELGIIPSDWKITPLKEFAKVVTGKTPPTKDSNYWNGKIPWFTPSDIGGKRDLFTSERKLSEKGYESNSAKLPPESVLVTCIASIGKNAITGVWSSCNQQINAILPNDNFNSNYLYYWISNNTPYYETNAAKTAVTIINKATFESLPVVLPPLPEQRKIAEILTTVDDHISETEALIEKTKILKQGLMQQLLTKGIGHTEFKDTEIGRIPAEWESTTIGNLSSIYRGASPRPINDSRWFADHSSIGWIRIADVTRSKKYLRETTQYLSNDGVEKSRLVERGKLIMSICGTIGRPIIIETPSCIHDGFIVFEDIDNRVLDTEFLYYWVLENEEYFRSQGQKGTQANINTDIVKSTFFAHPPIEEQHQIAAILTSVDDQIDTYQAKLTSLTRLKSGLMQQLLTGKIRVKV